VIASRMKETLVQARLGLDDLRGGLEQTRRRLAGEERELETVRRRKQLAEGIGDTETVGIAAKYEQLHSERVDVMRQKVSAQEAELQLAERDVAQMAEELRAVLNGTDPRSTATIDAPDVDGAPSSALGEEIDSLGRARASAEREADAARRLDELKRRMGK
jgi:hypothetical protein